MTTVIYSVKLICLLTWKFVSRSRPQQERSYIKSTFFSLYKVYISLSLKLHWIVSGWCSTASRIVVAHEINMASSEHLHLLDCKIKYHLIIKIQKCKVISHYNVMIQLIMKTQMCWPYFYIMGNTTKRNVLKLCLRFACVDFNSGLYI